MKLLNNNRGVTLTVLIITIIVLLILASTATYTGIQVIQNSEYTAFNAEMKIIQTEVNFAQERIETDGEENKKINNKLISEIGQNIPNNSDIEKMKNNMRTQWETTLDLTNYRYFEKEDLKNDLNIEEIKRVTPVLINLETASVISIKGIQKQGTTYYKLEQLPDNVNKVEYENPQTSAPTFNVTSETTGSYMKIRLSNIQINSQYVKKYKILYQAEGNSSWTTVAEDLTTDSYTFEVKVGGIYNIKIVDAKDQESTIESVNVKYNKTAFELSAESEIINGTQKIVINGISSNTIIDQVIIINENDETTYIENTNQTMQISEEYIPESEGMYIIKIEDEYGNISEEKKVYFTILNAKFEMPQLTSNDCMINGKRYIVTASSEIDLNRTAYKAFDGSLDEYTGCWNSNFDPPQWIQIQFQNQIKVKEFSIQNRVTNTNDNICAKDFILQGSNDGTNWNNLGNYTINIGSGEETNFEILNPEYYRYYKWNITSSYSGYATIGEIIFDDAEELMH